MGATVTPIERPIDHMSDTWVDPEPLALRIARENAARLCVRLA